MAIAVLQMQPSDTVATNLVGIEQAAKAAAAFGAFLLVTPEMGTTGYAIWEDIPRLAEARDGAIVRRLTEIAAAHDITLVAGFPERDGETIYNAALLVQPDGSKLFYRKCHLYGPLERAAFTPGAALPEIVTIRGIKTSVLICYDVEFPEMVRSLALAGADIICVPTALPRGPAALRVSDSMIRTRAFENHVTIIYADLCGEENSTPYQGGSVIAGPDGDILAQAGAREALLVTDYNMDDYDSATQDPYLKDRRAPLYRLD